MAFLDESEEHKRILEAIDGARLKFIEEGNEQGEKLAEELLDRLVGWCGPHARIEWPL